MGNDSGEEVGRLARAISLCGEGPTALQNQNNALTGRTGAQEIVGANARPRHGGRRMMAGILAIGTMTAGGLMYVLWRPESLEMFSWFAALGISNEVALARGWAAPFGQSLPDFICLSLPQALWLFSGCLAIHSIWGSWWCKGAQIWLNSIFGLAVALELGQAVGLVEGVFDYLDLGLILVAFVLAGITDLYLRQAA